MRVTTGMLNRNNGMIGSRKSLLSYVQQNKTGGAERLAAMGTARTSGALQRTQKAGYEKLKSTADRLIDGADQLARRADGDADCTREAKSFVEAYNQAMDTLGSETDVLNRYYHQMMKQTFSDNQAQLAELGITRNTAGKLVLDSEKLAAADTEKVKKLLGAEGDFVKRVSYVASRAADNAKVNIQNLSTAYNARGNVTNSYLSRYNLLG
ncbi:MAG: hypothetical protein NC541_04100 [bacterium]|nr:hypothetical protein [bacterium]